MQPPVFLVSACGQLCLSHGDGAAVRPADLRGAGGLPALHQQVRLPVSLQGSGTDQLAVLLFLLNEPFKLSMAYTQQHVCEN